MGIALLTKFVNCNGFFKSYQLHDTVLFIDGPNLIVSFTEKFNNERKDHFYAGDYNYYAHQLIQFFKALKKCKIEPIIVWESKTTDGSQMSKKLSRLNVEQEVESEGDKEQQIKNVTQKNEKSTQNTPKRLSTLMWPKIITSVITALQINQKISFYEADDLLTKVADNNISAPILSNDSDFFFANLPAGVISMNSLLENHSVCTTEEGVNYINCKRYTIEQFQLKFPGLDPKLLPIVATPFLDFEFTPLLETLTNKFQRMEQMWALFDWLSLQSSVKKAIEFLERSLKHHRELKLLIDQIKSKNMLANAQQEVETKSSNETKNKTKTPSNDVKSKTEKIFDETTDVIHVNFESKKLPKYIEEGVPSGKIHKRILFIFENRKDIFYPLVEDLNLKESAFSCSFKLRTQIYGILRASEDLQGNQITQFFGNQSAEIVNPEFYDKTTNQLLPSVYQVENLHAEDRLALFWNIVEIEPTFKVKIVHFFQKHIYYADILDMTQFATIFLSFIYFEQNFVFDLSIEFTYALLLNILLTGYTAKAEVFQKWCRLLHLESPPDLSAYDFVPTDMKYSFMPRITHYNNAFQSCLADLTFLAQVLDIQQFWYANELLFGLHGTFVYNLTKDLLKVKAPWTFLKETIFKESPVWPIYEDLVVLALEYSGRQLDDSLVGLKDVFPQFVVNKKMQTNTLKQKLLFTRGFKSKGKDSHISPKSEKPKPTPKFASGRFTSNSPSEGNWRRKPQH